MTEPPSQESDLIAATVDGHADGEATPMGEAEATAKIVAMIEETVRSSAAGGPAHRDAHPKAHGLARARCEVLAGLPADLAVGLFAEARAYDAWVRFSNASPTPRSDKIGDARGMAIKIVGVAASRSGTQDFLMIDFPRFLVRDAIDYVAFQSAASPLGFFFPSLSPFRWRLRELTIGRGITGAKIANPLNARYWSTTPLLFGAAACKVSARPSGPASAFTGAARADFLHANLAAHLAAGGATFDFWFSGAPSPARCPSRIPGSNGGRRKRPSSRWRGSRFRPR